MRALLSITILITSMLALCGIGWAMKELILASIPTPVIIAGCAVCVIFLAAVVLAAFKGITTTNKPQK